MCTLLIHMYVHIGISWYGAQMYNVHTKYIRVFNIVNIFSSQQKQRGIGAKYCLGCRHKASHQFLMTIKTVMMAIYKTTPPLYTFLPIGIYKTTCHPRSFPIERDSFLRSILAKCLGFKWTLQLRGMWGNFHHAVSLLQKRGGGIWGRRGWGIRRTRVFMNILSAFSSSWNISTFFRKLVH